MKYPNDAPDDDDDDLTSLFRAREAQAAPVALDVSAVYARAAELRAETRRTWLARTTSRAVRALQERNGAWLSGVGSLAAAACLFLSLGVHDAHPASSIELEATAGVCAEPTVGALSMELARPRAEATMSTDLRVSDARIVTCTPFGP